MRAAMSRAWIFLEAHLKDDSLEITSNCDVDHSGSVNYNALLMWMPEYPVGNEMKQQKLIQPNDTKSECAS
jgi:hypothetical protein